MVTLGALILHSALTLDALTLDAPTLGALTGMDLSVAVRALGLYVWVISLPLRAFQYGLLDYGDEG